MNPNTPVNPNAFSNQINNVTRNLMDLFSGNIAGQNPAPNNITPSSGLQLSDIRQHTTLTIYRELVSGEDAPTINCEVCHDNIKDGDILRVINTCGHSFHQECIDSWLESNHICPYCRGNIVATSPPEEVHLNSANTTSTINTTTTNTTSTSNPSTTTTNTSNSTSNENNTNNTSN